MWAKVAEEMQVPWRAAEAMHWQLGEMEMARRAGVVPFSLNMASSSESQGSRRISPSRPGHGHHHGHAHSQSQGSVPRDLSGFSSTRYGGPHGPGLSLIPPLIPPPPSHTHPTTASRSSFMTPQRRESLPPRPSFPLTCPEYPSPAVPSPDYGYGPGPTIPPLAPIQTTTLPPPTSGRGSGTSGGVLPSVAELTTGVSPYNSPAYTLSSAGTGGAMAGAAQAPGNPAVTSTSTTSPLSKTANASPGGTIGAAPGPLLPALSPYPPQPLQPPAMQPPPPLPPPIQSPRRQQQQEREQQEQGQEQRHAPTATLPPPAPAPAAFEPSFEPAKRRASPAEDVLDIGARETTRRRQNHQSTHYPSHQSDGPSGGYTSPYYTGRHGTGMGLNMPVPMSSTGTGPGGGPPVGGDRGERRIAGR